MNKLVKLLLIPLIFMTSCSSNNESESYSEEFVRPEEYYADFSGDLESMSIDYAKRNDGVMGVEYWWSKSKIITPDHYLVIAPQSEYGRLSGMTAFNGSVDYMTLTSFYFNDGAFSDALKLAMVDYDYRQVYVYHSKPASVTLEEYPEVLRNLFSEIRKNANEAEIFFVSNLQRDIDIVNNLNEQNVKTLVTKESETKNTIQTSISECTNVVTSHERDTDDYAVKSRETIEWSKIYFTNASTFANNNKRILHIGASVMFATYSHLKDAAPQYNIDCYCSSRGTNDKACLRELEFIFRQYAYDGIHFNGTSHVKSQTEEQCYQSVSALVDLFKLAEKDATILMSNSTPKGSTTDLEHFSDGASLDILDMTYAILRICDEQGFPFDDLYNFAKDNGFIRIDAIHYSSNGVEYPKLGKELARFFKQYIK